MHCARPLGPQDPGDFFEEKWIRCLVWIWLPLEVIGTQRIFLFSLSFIGIGFLDQFCYQFIRRHPPFLADVLEHLVMDIINFYLLHFQPMYL